MKRPLQRDLVALYIASRAPAWVHARELKASPQIAGGTVGSEGDRRAQEIFAGVQGDTAEWEVQGKKYLIERGGNKKDRQYRLVGSQEVRTKPKYFYRDPLTNELIEA